MLNILSGVVAILLWVPFGIIGWLGYGIDAFKKIDWQIKEPGIVYSVKQVESLALNATSTYISVLNELKPRYLRLIAYWDRIEKQAGQYDFQELDFLMKQAENQGIKTTLVIGLKVPRWPECHSPDWVKQLSGQSQEDKVLFEYLEAVVKRYQKSPALEYWQVENELFFKFGNCPNPSAKRLEAEISLVKSLDPAHPIVITGSGEASTWVRAFLKGDLVGISLYRQAVFLTSWFSWRLNYPLPPLFYGYKAKLMTWFFRKPLMITELQLEPWFDSDLKQVLVSSQTRVLPLTKFQKTIKYAAQTRISRVYFWGVEWWYWLNQQGVSDYWQYVKQTVFKN
jgi:hypothetical protein